MLRDTVDDRCDRTTWLASRGVTVSMTVANITAGCSGPVVTGL
jgi:hypothetical protein